MKTVVKINPDKEYDSAKATLAAIQAGNSSSSYFPVLSDSIDNMKTVIDVLRERLGPKKRKRPPKRTNRDLNRKRKKEQQDRTKLPSEKFPDLQIEEKIVKDDKPPQCACCSQPMHESGLYKTSEKLEVIPKQYHITRSKRVIYNCPSCNGSMQNAKPLPSISPKSNYGDSLIIDVALSKYADLIPIERQTAISSREGSVILPANSLIDTTHALAGFFDGIYTKIRYEVLREIVLRCDETPHKMLEGDDKTNWFLWGFFGNNACYFEVHNTRSGDVPLAFLRDSKAQYLLTDAYGGYEKAINILKEEGRIVIPAFCNAHAFRYFEEAEVNFQEEASPFLEQYGEIYDLERKAENPEEKLAAREKMGPIFTDMLSECDRIKDSLMPHSAIEKAVNYFINQYPGLAECAKNIDISLDNNPSERCLRGPVVGRKTWYGTHSKRGAKTNAILFSIVESCKINHVNPRRYFPDQVKRIHESKEPLTPSEYARLDSG